MRTTFFITIHNGHGDHPAPCKMCAGSLSRGKEAGEWRYPLTPSIAEVKERVELYFHSVSAPSLPITLGNKILAHERFIVFVT
jgi:hypothetical protein